MGEFIMLEWCLHHQFLMKSMLERKCRELHSMTSRQLASEMDGIHSVKKKHIIMMLCSIAAWVLTLIFLWSLLTT